jgi:hypothetical protein
MTRGLSSFRKGDVRRAVEAVVKATGAPVQRVEIDRAGKVVVIVGKPGGEPCGNNNEWDEVLDRGKPAP